MVELDISILIPSCDKYSDIWEIFFHYFWKNWPDCPYPVYLGSNFKKYDDKRISSITIGYDKTWCSNLQNYLEKIKTKYVILFLDDFIIEEKIHTDSIKKMIKFLSMSSAGCLRLKPAPSPSKPLNYYREIGEILPGEPYRISTQVAIWDKNYLQKIAYDKFNIWEFELLGSYLSDHFPEIILGVYNPIINYRHCIERGKWIPDKFASISREGLLGSTDRMVLPSDYYENKKNNLILQKTMQMTPRKIRRLIRLIKPNRIIKSILEEIKKNVRSVP